MRGVTLISRHHFDVLQNVTYGLLRGLLIISIFTMPLAGCSYNAYTDPKSLFEGVEPDYDIYAKGFLLENRDMSYFGQALYKDIEKMIINKSSRPINRQSPLRIATNLEGFTTNIHSQSSRKIGKKSSLIISALRQASGGKLTFLDRNQLAVALKERGLKGQGVEDKSALGLAANAGADYMLFLDRIDSESSTSRGILGGILLALTVATLFVLTPITAPIIAYNDLGIVTTQTFIMSFSLVDLKTGATFDINKQITKKRSEI